LLERLGREKHSSLLGPFIIYNEIKSFEYAILRDHINKHLMFLITYEWAKKARVYYYTARNAWQGETL
jgi:hypothetical protein